MSKNIVLTIDENDKIINCFYDKKTTTINKDLMHILYLLNDSIKFHHLDNMEVKLYASILTSLDFEE